uniref:Uncharacterized protein n=1 Tax=Fagus sylvatica TaxID=28930 RepID=A0A2N9HXJ3_FAGSY
MVFLRTSSFCRSPSHFPSLQPHIHNRTTLHFRTSHSLATMPPPFPHNPKSTHLHHHHSHKKLSLTVRASPQNSHSSNNNNSKLIFITSSLTIALAVANRVLYKLALVPMKEYPFFLAQFTTFGYVAIYFSILYMRYRAGIVTDEMLALPKWRFMAIGVLEALGVATGMSAGAMLPGPAIPILSQGEVTHSIKLLAAYSSATGVVVAVASKDQKLDEYKHTHDHFRHCSKTVFKTMSGTLGIAAV